MNHITSNGSWYATLWASSYTRILQHITLFISLWIHSFERCMNFNHEPVFYMIYKKNWILFSSISYISSNPNTICGCWSVTDRWYKDPLRRGADAKCINRNGAGERKGSWMISLATFWGRSSCGKKRCFLYRLFLYIQFFIPLLSTSFNRQQTYFGWWLIVREILLVGFTQLHTTLLYHPPSFFYLRSILTAALYHGLILHVWEIYHGLVF